MRAHESIHVAFESRFLRSKRQSLTCPGDFVPSSGQCAQALPKEHNTDSVTHHLELVKALEEAIRDLG